MESNKKRQNHVVSIHAVLLGVSKKDLGSFGRHTRRETESRLFLFGHIITHRVTVYVRICTNKTHRACCAVPAPAPLETSKQATCALPSYYCSFTNTDNGDLYVLLLLLYLAGDSKRRGRIFAPEQVLLLPRVGGKRRQKKKTVVWLFFLVERHHSHAPLIASRSEETFYCGGRRKFTFFVARREGETLVCLYYLLFCCFRVKRKATMMGKGGATRSVHGGGGPGGPHRLRWVGRLDMYRKIPADLMEGTRRGSYLSLMAAIIMLCLFLMETGAFLQKR